MERAVARIDFDAVRANCARLRSSWARGPSSARWSRPTATATVPTAAPPPPSPAARRRLAVATAAEAEQVGRRFQHVPLLTMGALTARGRRHRRSRPGRRSPSGARASAACSPIAPAPRAARLASTSSTTAAWGGSATPTPSEVLALARACDASPDLELAGIWTHLRHRRRTGLGLLRRAARSLRARLPPRSGRSSPRSPSTPPTAPPSSATGAPTSTWPAAASRSTGSTPSRAIPAERGLRPALSLRSYVADVKRFAPGD